MAGPRAKAAAPTAALTMRELLALAREQLGAGAGRYKTRQALLVALGLDAAQQPAPPPDGEDLVTRDFFVEPASPE